MTFLEIDMFPGLADFRRHFLGVGWGTSLLVGYFLTVLRWLALSINLLLDHCSDGRNDEALVSLNVQMVGLFY